MDFACTRHLGMGREILQKPTVLVVSQPTWGVDAGAAARVLRTFVRGRETYKAP